MLTRKKFDKAVKFFDRTYGRTVHQRIKDGLDYEDMDWISIFINSIEGINFDVNRRETENDVWMEADFPGKLKDSQTGYVKHCSIVFDYEYNSEIERATTLTDLYGVLLDTSKLVNRYKKGGIKI